MDHNQNKLEDPGRLAELNPNGTLKKIGLGERDVVCDIGAGSGIFTISAAQITRNSVFALEVNDEFLGIIREKADREKLTNIIPDKVTDFHYDIGTESVDLVILVTVLHEIDKKAALLTEIKRILKSTGKLAIIEFHKKQTPIGPPVPHRISKDEVLKICSDFDFYKSGEFDLGDNFYCIVLNS